MQFFITGTDTDVGKTVAAAWAVTHLNASYWKPIQCGTEEGTDASTVADFANLSEDRVIPSTYVLKAPLSPHEAAKREGAKVELNAFKLPSASPLIAEGAGGLMVPLNDEHYVADLIKALGIPAILVCRSTLGTINHTLLSLEAIRVREIPLAGVILNGPITPHNREAIEQYGEVRVIAEIPPLEQVDKDTLLAIKPEIELSKLTQ